MKKTKTLSPEVLKAAKDAASYEYDKSKYIVIDMSVRRDVDSGRLIVKNKTTPPVFDGVLDVDT